MPLPAKPLIVTLVSAVIFAFGAVPANATESAHISRPFAAADATPSQALNTTGSLPEGEALDALTQMSDLSTTPASYNVSAAIALAESEIGTSRSTGWAQPGECIESARRWLLAGGAAWTGSGDPVSNYRGATRLPLANAQPGDIIQYENLAYPTSWVSGVHTVLVTGVNGDGTLTIIQSNKPAGSGLVSKETNWVPQPPAGFAAVVWRF